MEELIQYAGFDCINVYVETFEMMVRKSFIAYWKDMGLTEKEILSHLKP